MPRWASKKDHRNYDCTAHIRHLLGITALFTVLLTIPTNSTPSPLSKKTPRRSHRDLLTTPYGFRVHVYYDIVTSEDFIVLTHGKPYDSRDYDASLMLLKHHIPNDKIQMVMNSPDRLVKKPDYAEALNRHRLYVDRWIFLDRA
jgi:hypothetical protein